MPDDTATPDRVQAGPLEVLIAYASRKIAELDALGKDPAVASYRAGQRTAWVDLYWKLGDLIDQEAVKDA